MEIRTTLSSKGQLVIPKHLRQLLGLHEGSELQMNLRMDNVLEVTPIKRDIKEFFGKGARKHSKVEDIDAAIEAAILENGESC